MKRCSPLFVLGILHFILTWLPNQSTYAQNSGIGTNDPTHTLHVKPLDLNPVRDPLRVENLQHYISETDSMLLVVDPDSGVIRIMHLDSLIQLVSSGISVSSSVPVNASSVILEPAIDYDHDDISETNVQQALSIIYSQLPKGIFKSIGEARSAGLEDGDSFYTHPEGVFGCSGCIIKLQPGMN